MGCAMGIIEPSPPVITYRALSDWNVTVKQSLKRSYDYSDHLGNMTVDVDLSQLTVYI